MAKKILIVEDEAIIALDVRFKLEDMGHQVLTADNADDGIEICEKENPDLIIADINIKGDKNGIEMAEILSEKGFKVIFLSANPNNVEINLREGEELIYIRKPLNLHLFTETINEIFKE